MEGLPKSPLSARRGTSRIPSFAASLIALLSALGSNVSAQDEKTRDQVRKELAEAQRTGNIIGAGEASLTLRELHPQQYPPSPAATGMTREQVKARLADAIRNGDVVTVGEVGQTLRERYPQSYPAEPLMMGQTRRQVRSELAEAIRSGDILSAGESSLTLRERYPQQYGSAAGTRGRAAGKLSTGT